MQFKNPSLVSLMLLALASPHSISHAYPDKPIKVIVIDPQAGRSTAWCVSTPPWFRRKASSRWWWRTAPGVRA